MAAAILVENKTEVSLDTTRIADSWSEQVLQEDSAKMNSSVSIEQTTANAQCSSNFTEELLASLSDVRVVEAIRSVVKPKIQSAIDAQVLEVQKKLSAMKIEAEKVSEKLADLSSKVEHLERTSRLSNLIISCLPVEQNLEEPVLSTSGRYYYKYGSAARADIDPMSCFATEQSVLKLFNENLGIRVTENDLVCAFRMSLSRHQVELQQREAQQSAVAQTIQRPPSIFVRFANRKVRDCVYRARYKIRRTMGVFINEDQTRAAYELFQQARRLLAAGQLFSTWTMAGVVYVQFSINQRNGQKITDAKQLPRLRTK